MARTSTNRLTREDWADAALAVIGESGVESVAIEPLALVLGVTKGSFYWHFHTRRELVDAALIRWEQRATADIITALSPIADPEERLRTLFSVAFLDTPEDRIEDAIVRAVADPLVDAAVDRVNTQRLEYLVAVFRELGHPLAEARHRARVGYSVLLGHRRLQASTTTRLSKAAVRRFGDELARSLAA